MSTAKLIPPRVVAVVGAGGVGSWLLHALVKLVNGPPIYIWDPDVLERRNLDRQLFRECDIGKPKAEAIAGNLGCRNIIPRDGWFQSGSVLEDGALIFCCVDNRPSQLCCIRKADQVQGSCILCANEYTDATGDYYQFDMEGTPNDPRVFDPSFLSDHTGDPTAPAGCTGLAAAAAPQLVIANKAAATYGLQLMWFWFAERHNYPPGTKEHWPVSFRSSALKHQTIKYSERV